MLQPSPATVDDILAEDILFYTLQHEKLTCRCGEIHTLSRLSVTTKAERGGRSTRFMGMSETFYTKKEVKEVFLTGGTPACGACISTIKRTEWRARGPSAVDASRSNILSMGNAKSPSSPRERKVEANLDDILGAIDAKTSPHA